MSVADVVSEIDGVAACWREALTQLESCQQAAEDLSQRFAALGSERIPQVLAETVRQCDDAAGRLRDALAALEEARGTVTSTEGDGGTSTAGAISTGSAPPTRGIAGFTSRRPVAECTEAIRNVGWPKDNEGKLKARGHLYDNDGANVFDRTLCALPKGQTYDAPELREPWRSDPDMTTTWHIEGGVAAHMRRTGKMDGTLYLNAPTCGGDDRDSKRCYQNVEKTLPAGATLTVWSILESGEKRRVRFRGTGEAIES